MLRIPWLTTSSKLRTQSLESSARSSNFEAIEADLHRRLHHAQVECRDHVQKYDEFRGESACLAPKSASLESSLAFEVRKREQQHHQEVTAMQKDLEVAESLIQTGLYTKSRTSESDKVSVGRKVNVA